MSTFIKKLSSRKLWACVAGFVSGLAIAFGLDETIITTVSGAVVAVASVVTYIITEGKVDAAAVSTAATAVQGAVSVVTGTSADTNVATSGASDVTVTTATGVTTETTAEVPA